MIQSQGSGLIFDRNTVEMVPIWYKYLDSVVLAVGNQHIALAVSGDSANTLFRIRGFALGG
jgi:hypothetical protein